MYIDIDAKIKELTLEQKIGQLIIGQAEGTKMQDGFSQYIKSYPLCGYRINGANIENRGQITEFNKAIKAIYNRVGTGVEPILASDQEGGSLSVFGRLMTEFPGNMALGAAGEDSLAFLQGNVTGWELSRMGIDLAFAPVADVNLDKSNPVIGVRSFGDNPEKVAALCTEFLKGLNSGGTAGCGKHFPGHGNTNVDSHCELPLNSTDFKTLEETELVPFKGLVQNNADSIMVSHVLYPFISEDELPASISKKIIKGLLREKLKYDGVITSDDMEMEAIVKNYSLKEAARLFISAGGDILLINCTRQGVIDTFDCLLSAVYEGLITEERIDESLKRIFKLKNRIKMYLENRKQLSKNPEKLSVEISKKAVTLVHRNPGVLPIKKDQRVLIIKPQQIKLTYADTTDLTENNLFKYIKTYAKDVKEISISLEKEENLEKIVNYTKSFDVIIQCTINCIRFPWQISLMNKIKEYTCVVAVMLRDPYDCMLMPDDVSKVAAYSANNNNMMVTADLLYGKYEFGGKLPVQI